MPTDERDGGQIHGDRRRFLKAVGAASVVGAAGCLGDDDGDTPTETWTAAETETRQETETATATRTHTPTPEPLATWHRDHDWEQDPEAATDWDTYSITKLLDQGDFMDIELAPDGRLFYITRGQQGTGGGAGTFEVGYVDPDTGNSGIVLEHETRLGTDGTPAIDTPSRETGGQGIALAPDFAETGHVYLNYHPRFDAMDDVGPTPYDQFWDGEVEQFGYKLVSRWTLQGGAIDPGSEVEVIRIPQQYDSCCHHGGTIEFGPEGHLWISVGDNSAIASPYSPIDDRESRHPAYDAARTAQNTADLRGSILRITPEADGGYTIPGGNLKEVHERRVGESFSEEAFRPEIFSMGYRNPYVISVDEHTGYPFTGDYAPGYGNWTTGERGPPGIAGFRLICEPDNAGWPFFKGYYPYRRYDHDAGEVGQPYWIDNPRNDSRNNTGIERIPPIEPDLIWQPQRDQTGAEYTDAPAWVDMPQPGELSWNGVGLGGSGGNNAGPAYRYSEEYGETALPPYFEAKQFAITAYGDHRTIWFLGFRADGGLLSVDIEEFLPDAPWVGETPHHMEIGPDGRAFVSNYGDGFYMIEYRG